MLSERHRCRLLLSVCACVCVGGGSFKTPMFACEATIGSGTCLVIKTGLYISRQIWMVFTFDRISLPLSAPLRRHPLLLRALPWQRQGALRFVASIYFPELWLCCRNCQSASQIGLEGRRRLCEYILINKNGRALGGGSRRAAENWKKSVAPDRIRSAIPDFQAEGKRITVYILWIRLKKGAEPICIYVLKISKHTLVQRELLVLF